MKRITLFFLLFSCFALVQGQQVHAPEGDYLQAPQDRWSIHYQQIKFLNEGNLPLHVNGVRTDSRQVVAGVTPQTVGKGDQFLVEFMVQYLEKGTHSGSYVVETDRGNIERKFTHFLPDDYHPRTIYDLRATPLNGDSLVLHRQGPTLLPGQESRARLVLENPHDYEARVDTVWFSIPGMRLKGDLPVLPPQTVVSVPLVLDCPENPPQKLWGPVLNYQYSVFFVLDNGSTTEVVLEGRQVRKLSQEDLQLAPELKVKRETFWMKVPAGTSTVRDSFPIWNERHYPLELGKISASVPGFQVKCSHEVLQGKGMIWWEGPYREGLESLVITIASNDPRKPFRYITINFREE